MHAIDDLPLTAVRLREALATAEQWLARNRDAINAINVYPVPDGDTGTNMLLTFRAALDAGESSNSEVVGDYLEAVARGALLGARGNSGVILSQMVRGFASAVAGEVTLDADALCRGFEGASSTAYAAVSEPVEGTMLTVMREAAEAAAGPPPLPSPARGGADEASQADEGVSVARVLQAAQTAAEVSVERTPELLPLLRDAGVVDAGGLGVAVLLAGLRMGYLGEALPVAPLPASGSVELSAVAHEGHGYCTEYLLEAADGALLQREALLAALEGTGGDSLLVVGDERALHVHVHVADPGPALSAGAAAGSLRNIKIDNMQLQHEAWAAAHEAASATPVRLPALGLVAVAAGPGIAAAFRELGATTLLMEDGTKPSAGAFLEAARRAGSEHVFLLPNDKDTVMAAEQAALEAPDFVSVVPARSLPAGMTAAVAFLPDDGREQAAQAMQAAIRGVRCVEVTLAARDVAIGGVAAAAAQPIALCDGTLVATGATLEAALLAGLATAVEETSELLTVYMGKDAPPDAGAHVSSLLLDAYPALAVEIVAGGQPYYPYIVGVE